MECGGSRFEDIIEVLARQRESGGYRERLDLVEKLDALEHFATHIAEVKTHLYRQEEQRAWSH